MNQFKPTGEQIAQEIALEGYGDPEKVRMRGALEAIRRVVAEAPTALGHTTSVMFRIDQLTRQGLAP